MDSGRPFPHTKSRGQTVVGRLHVSGKALEQQNRLGSLGDQQIDIEMGECAKKNNIPKKDRNLIVFPSKEWGSNTPFLYFIGVSVVDLLQLSQVCNWNS
jgi:hypothetical protein